MKLLRYGPAGEEKPGLLDQDGTIRDLSNEIDDVAGAALDDQVLQRLARIDPSSLPAVEGNPRLGPCVGGVGKFIAIGLNYYDHARETDSHRGEHPIHIRPAGVTGAVHKRIDQALGLVLLIGRDHGE